LKFKEKLNKNCLDHDHVGDTMSMHKASNISSIHETLVHLSYAVSAIFCLEGS